MGYTVRLSPGVARPTQKRIDYTSLGWMLHLYKEGREHELLPPVARYFPEHFSIDGHNRMLLADLFHRDLDVYVPKHEEDILDPSRFPSQKEAVAETNLRIQTAFGVVIRSAAQMEKEGIMTFEDLRHFWEIHDVCHLERLCMQHKH